MYNFFVSRVRTNLHLVICLSPIGEAFRTRLRMFPSLVNCCTIDWFSEWPEEALQSVANFFLASVELDATIKKGYSLIYLLTHWLTHSLTGLLTHSLAYSLTHWLTHSPTYSLTHLLTHSQVLLMSVLICNCVWFNYRRST